MKKNTKLGFAPEESETPKESRFEKWMDNDYAPCTKLLICAIKEKDDMSVGGRILLGTMAAIGVPVIDTSVWICKKLGLQD